MPDPIVWGMLPKSQTDSQTLADYIASQFEDHNDDPDAHADTGQALDVHRTGIILDHPAGCIVTDKLVAGCVTSDKITSDQIVSKDIRTAEDVGVGVDGVKVRQQGVQVIVIEAVAQGRAAQGQRGQVAVEVKCGGSIHHGQDVSQ